jgi:hypothetical protein
MMKLIELILDESMLLTGIDAISLVEYPAIEEDFIALNAQRIEFATQSDEKRILMGAALVPNKPIYRAEGEEEFYVYFSEATIRKASEMFFQKSKQNNATLEHEVGINGLTVVESWIIEDDVQDKSKKYGFDLPIGTWMVSMKVNNPEIWTNFVKTGKVKGFSIEGYFVDKLNLAKQEMAHLEEQEAALMLSQIVAIIKRDGRKKSGSRIEMESYSDYPQAVSNNAKRGIELNEKNGNKCATSVGKIRAATLAAKRPVSVETITRMYSYLSRAETYYDEGNTEACGTISFLLWGGLAGKRWAESKLKELGKIELKEGVPHYTADGKLYEGLTHTHDGRLMTGAEHTEDSEYLYHKEDLKNV